MKKVIKFLNLKTHILPIILMGGFTFNALAQCNISNLVYEPHTVKDNEVIICYDFEANQTESDSYDVFFNNNKIKTSKYTDSRADACITISKEDFLSQNTLTIQDITNRSCQAELVLDLVYGVYTNGLFGGCYSNFDVQKTDCENEGDYYIQLFFEETLMNGAGTFNLKANNEAIGTFKYSDLPLEIGPYRGDQQIDLTFDDTQENCGGNIQLLSGACPNTSYPCKVDELVAELNDCPDENKQAFLELDFDIEYAPSESFYLYYYYEDASVDSVLYQYDELPLDIGPFTADGRTAYGVCVADATNLDCRKHIYLNEISCVYPGDADANPSNIINHFDILKVGEAFGFTGLERSTFLPDPNPEPTPIDSMPGSINTGNEDDIDTSTIYILGAETAPSWNQTFKDGLDYKHADCNGDGVINRKDAVLIDNYYNFKQPLEGEYNFIEEREKGIPMSVKLPDERVPSLTPVELPIQLGTKDVPVQGLYGLAFSLYLDTNVISTTNIEVDFNDSWLGNDGDPLLSIVKFNEETGKLDVGLTKSNGNSIFGFGSIATLRIIILIDIEPEKRASNFFSVNIDEVLISTKSDGYESIVNQGINLQSDKAQIVTNVTYSQLPQDLKIYPTIANQSFFIEKTSTQPIDLAIYDLIGNTLYRNSLVNHLTAINTNQWNAGVYYINFIVDNKIYNRRIVVQH